MKNTGALLLALGSVLAMAMPSAQAAPAGFYGSVGLGRAEEKPGTSAGLNIASIGFPIGGIAHVLPDRVSADGRNLAWNAMVGYRINPYVAAEVAYMDLGTTNVSEHYTLGTSLFPFPVQLTRSYSSKVSGPALSVLGSLPVGARFDVFLRAGVFFADRKVQQTPASGGLGSNTFGSRLWLGGVGVDWSIASRWAARLEYQRTDQFDTTLLTGRARVDQLALNVLFRL